MIFHYTSLWAMWTKVLAFILSLSHLVSLTVKKLTANFIWFSTLSALMIYIVKTQFLEVKMVNILDFETLSPSLSPFEMSGERKGTCGHVWWWVSMTPMVSGMMTTIITWLAVCPAWLTVCSFPLLGRGSSTLVFLVWRTDLRVSPVILLFISLCSPLLLGWDLSVSSSQRM